MTHRPVLLKEVIQYLDPKPGDKVVDGTFNGGGHSLVILEKIKPGGKILGIELDPELFNEAKEKFSGIKDLILINDNYRNLKKIVGENNFGEANGVLLDLGLSSWHLAESKRGFSFQKDEPLDMRFDKKDEFTAAGIINQWPPQEVERVLKEYGEENFSKQITKEIVEARKKKPIISTFQLIEVIKKSVPFWYQHKKLHFATKTFQALRIAVNDELENLEAAIKQLPEVLVSKGRGVIISFHSLEDRIVKKRFRELKDRGAVQIITKKPIVPTFEEVRLNPRSRSAKLRVIEII